MLFDYIIIGAGSAGCVLADRLSADPATRVLLLRSGLVPDLGTDAVLVTLAGVLGALGWFWAVRGTPARFLFVRPAWARLKPKRVATLQPAE